MTVAVTGASGHIGGNLVRALVERGRRVRCLVHRDVRALEGLSVERVVGDVLDPTSLDVLLDGIDVVFHLAAVISIDGDRGGCVHAVNVDGTRNVARAALAAGVRRLLHCSSIHAFEKQPLDEPLDETRARATGERHAAYDRSKAAGEAAIREAVADGLDAVILNPTAVIGPNDFAPSRIGQVLIDLYRRRFPALIDGGFDWVDVRDVAGGLLAAEQRGRTGEGYILSGSWHSLRRLAALSAEVTGVPPPRLTAPGWLARLGAPIVTSYQRIFGGTPLFTGESVAALASNRQVARSKAERELGYRARPLSDTLRDTYGWLARTGAIDAPDLAAVGVL